MFRRKRREQADFSEELRAHMALEADQLRAEGVSVEEAQLLARRRMGNLTSSEERFYEHRRWMWAEQFAQDVRFALRQWHKSAGFTAVAVLTLALGIGANTAIFTLMNAIMLRSMPVANPRQIYRLGEGDSCCVNSGYQTHFSIYSYPLYTYLRDHTPEFEELAALQVGLGPLNVRRDGAATPQVFTGEFVSGNYFRMWGVGAYAGRILTPADDTRDAPPAAMMSFRAWEQTYGRDPLIIGAHFTIDGQPFTIAGITPPGFYGDTLRADPPDLWLPLGSEPSMHGRNALLERADQHWLYAVGRLKSGVAPATVEARVNVELKQWWLDNAGQYLNRKRIEEQHISVTPAGSGLNDLKERYAGALRILLFASGLVLLIACANIANLLLARGAANRVQASIRMALGAARGRVIRQTLTESLVLSLIGGLAGLIVAWGGARLLLAIAFRGSRYVPVDAAPSIPVVAFALVVSILTGVIFGVVPAWFASRQDPAGGLRGAGRSTGRRSAFFQRMLVVIQAALSLVLLIGAGLLALSLRNLEHQQFGFDPEDRLIVRVQAAFTGYTPERLYQLYQQLPQRLQALPGVRSASFSLNSPLTGGNWSSGIYIEGRPVSATGETRDSSSWLRISPRYFDTIGSRILRGRGIDDRDTPNAPMVAVVSQAFARKFFPGQDPIGKRFGMVSWAHQHDCEIVGVVEDAKYTDARDTPGPTFFVPYLQMAPGYWNDNALARSNYPHFLQLHVARDEQSLEPRIRQTLAEIDPNITVVRVLTLADQVAINFNRDRLIARLAELFGMLALVLACIGLYGVTAYSVASRTGEIGIRTALGASRAGVVMMILRGAMAQIAFGLAIGLPAALWAGGNIRSQLFGVENSDPAILAGAAGALIACAALAAFVPARRATRIDPIQALRAE
jgi:predicted permease